MTRVRRVRSNWAWLQVAVLVAACWLGGTPVRAASSRDDAPLMRFPTVSTTQIAFVAKGDLWTVSRAGGSAIRLTDDQGQVLAPHFSPDGRSIAFTWRRAGLNDVYVMPATGGAPIRLTHGPSYAAYDNLVTGWSPDGTTVMFVSRRGSPLRGLCCAQHWRPGCFPWAGSRRPCQYVGRRHEGRVRLELPEPGW